MTMRPSHSHQRTTRASEGASLGPPQASRREHHQISNLNAANRGAESRRGVNGRAGGTVTVFVGILFLIDF